MTNPYTPPSSEVRDPEKPPGSAFKALSLALLTDIGGIFNMGGAGVANYVSILERVR